MGFALRGLKQARFVGAAVVTGQDRIALFMAVVTDSNDRIYASHQELFKYLLRGILCRNLNLKYG